jgi:hypothetical protein
VSPLYHYTPLHHKSQFNPLSIALSSFDISPHQPPLSHSSSILVLSVPAFSINAFLIHYLSVKSISIPPSLSHP